MRLYKLKFTSECQTQWKMSETPIAEPHFTFQKKGFKVKSGHVHFCMDIPSVLTFAMNISSQLHIEYDDISLICQMRQKMYSVKAKESRWVLATGLWRSEAQYST